MNSPARYANDLTPAPTRSEGESQPGPLSRKKPRELVPGTGLPLGAYAGIVVVSIALFIFWDGAIWSAPREASHVGRFVVSYLAVIPLAAAALALLRVFTWERLITATGTAWALKLVVTALLYQAFARGTAARIDPVRPRASAAAPPVSADYHPAAGTFATGVLRGRAVLGGAPAAGAIVFIDNPPPGAPIKSSARIEIAIQDGSYASAAYLARSSDEIVLRSADHRLHTAHLYAGARSIANVPLPPSGEEIPLSSLDPGVYALRCDTHKGELSSLVIVDHPYATRAERDGSFVIPGAPASRMRLQAAAAGITSPFTTLDVPKGETVELILDIGAAR